MKVLDPGHYYELDHLDGDDHEYLVFVKREGEKFPGNVGHYEGTNIQEVLRVLIDRVEYLDKQKPNTHNSFILYDLREALWMLERRAAMQHDRSFDIKMPDIEKQPVCGLCGHIGCNRSCHASRS